MKKIVIGILLLMCVSIAGCESKKETRQYDQTAPSSYLLEQVNRIDEQEHFECSAYASAYLLRHFGQEASGVELFKTFPDKLPNEQGAYYTGIVKFFEHHGFQAEFHTDGTIEDLRQIISSGVPVIVYIHAEEPYASPHYTHYVPVIGYDETYLYLAGSLPYLVNVEPKADVPYNRKVELSKFERLWTNVENEFEHPYFEIRKKGP